MKRGLVVILLALAAVAGCASKPTSAQRVVQLYHAQTGITLQAHELNGIQQVCESPHVRASYAAAQAVISGKANSITKHLSYLFVDTVQAYCPDKEVQTATAPKGVDGN